MKRKYHHINSLLLAFFLISCSNKQDRDSQITYTVDGPFTKKEITKEFNLDSISKENFISDYFILTIENNENLEISISTNHDDRIFPYSSHLHSYNAYSSLERTWQEYTYSKSKNIELLKDTILKKGKQSKFWYSSFYNKYVDTLYSHFEFKYPSKKVFQRTFIQNFNPAKRPKLEFQLKETRESKEYMKLSEISFDLQGPFTYSEINSKLRTNIKFENDIEELFLVNIENNSKDTAYIEGWPNKEIQMDTIAGYNIYADNEWYEIINKKPIETDTTEIYPTNKETFWIKFSAMTPSLDSIVMQKTIKTNKYVFTLLKHYEVERIKN